MLPKLFSFKILCSLLLVHGLLFVPAARWSVSQEPSVSNDGSKTTPAKCYDWIVHEKLRGGYLAASQTPDIVAPMKSAGFNVVMPKFNDLTTPPSEEQLALLERCSKATALPKEN
jgi:hypothetical protein